MVSIKFKFAGAALALFLASPSALASEAGGTFRGSLVVSHTAERTHDRGRHGHGMHSGAAQAGWRGDKRAPLIVAKACHEDAESLCASELDEYEKHDGWHHEKNHPNYFAVAACLASSKETSHGCRQSMMQYYPTTVACAPVFHAGCPALGEANCDDDSECGESTLRCVHKLYNSDDMCPMCKASILKEWSQQQSLKQSGHGSSASSPADTDIRDIIAPESLRNGDMDGCRVISFIFQHPITVLATLVLLLSATIACCVRCVRRRRSRATMRRMAVSQSEIPLGIVVSDESPVYYPPNAPYAHVPASAPAADIPYATVVQ